MLRRIAKDTIIYGIAKFFSVSLSLLTLPFFTNAFSLAEFGLLSLILSASSILPIVYGASIENSLVRFFNDKNYKNKHTLQIILKFQIVYGCLALILTFIISNLILIYFGYQEIWHSVLLALSTSFISQIIIIFQNIARMRQKPINFIKIYLSTAICSIIFSVIFVLNTPSILSYFIGYFLGNLVGFIVGFYVLNIFKISIWEQKIKEIKPFLKFSIPLIPAAIALILNNNIDIWFVGYFLNNSYVAIYSIGIKIASIATMGISLIMFAFLPYSMKIIEMEKDISDKILESLIRYYTIIVTVGTLLLQMSSILILKLFFSEDYYNSVTIIGILSMSSVFFGYTYFSTLGSWKGKKSFHYSIAITIGVILNASLNFVLIPILGIIGSAISTSFGMFITIVISFYLSNRVIRYKYSFTKLIFSNLIIILFLSIFIIKHYDKNFYFIINSLFFIFLFLILWINLSKDNLRYINNNLSKLFLR